MLISKEWLSEFVDLRGHSDEEIAREFTLRVAEVEGVTSEAAAFEQMFVGQIVGIDAHPQADRLRVCRVDVGARAPLQIVCGGLNLALGQKVALACVGARVRWHGEGDLVELQPTEIRGVKSDGMICGADEIGLSAEFPKQGEKEILDLSHLKAAAGTPLAHALGKTDVLFELDNKALSNRPDLWGVQGIARECGAVFDVRVKLPQARPIVSKPAVRLEVRVADATLCPRYQAVVVSGVAGNAKSPLWMQRRLNASGVRPVSAIVDVMNYVMLEGGQPLHAFDYDAIGGAGGRAEIHARAGRAGEQIAALDGKMYDVPAGAPIIAVDKEVVAVAGVIGSARHSVNDATTRVVIESANFNAGAVRRGATRLRLRTESSSRFEKSLDPHQTAWGLARAVELLRQVFPQATAISRVVDVKRSLPKPRAIVVLQSDLDRMIGGGVKLTQAKKILQRLGFVCSGTPQRMRVTVPTFRVKDVSGVHDLIEEIVRLFGFDRLPSSLPEITMRTIAPDPVVVRQFEIKQLCALRHALTEVQTYAFVRPQTAAAFGYVPDELITLANPLSAERPHLAPLLAMNLAEVIEKNQHGREEVAVFEIAKVFGGSSTRAAVPPQPTHLCIALSGAQSNGLFARMREIIASVAAALGYEVSVELAAENRAWWRAGHAADVRCGERTVGFVAAMHSSARKKLGIDHEVVIAEIDLTDLLSQAPRARAYHSVGVYQQSVRDSAVCVDEGVTAQKLIEVVGAAHPLVRHAEIFDIFRDEKIGAHKKAVALHITYSARDHTLTSAELDAAHQKVTDALARVCGAVIR